MGDIKTIAKTMNVEEFEKRFTQEHQGIRDTKTGKVHFCMSDFGFKFTQNDCLKTRDCKACYKNSMEYLEFRAEQRKQAIE